MNPIIEMYDHLAVALTGDVQLLLASAVAALDPFWNQFEDEIEYESDPLYIALNVTRGAFPDIYADAVERLRCGAPFAELDTLLCRAITAKGIPLDSLEAISYGIPLNSCGVDLEDPDFYAVHTPVLPALAPFGIDTPEAETYSIDVPQCVHTAGRAIVGSLHDQDDPTLKQVGWLYAWLFGCSGNSLVDLSLDDLYELQPLSWSEDDIAFAVEMIEEADGVMTDAMAGLKHLQASPDLQAALTRNVAILYRELKEKGKLHDRIRLHWSRPDSGADRTAVPDPLVLQLRGDAA
jgi:hypothetical protein